MLKVKYICIANPSWKNLNLSTALIYWVNMTRHIGRLVCLLDQENASNVKCGKYKIQLFEGNYWLFSHLLLE